jgi:hypothetical protein
MSPEQRARRAQAVARIRQRILERQEQRQSSLNVRQTAAAQRRSEVNQQRAALQARRAVVNLQQNTLIDRNYRRRVAEHEARERERRREALRAGVRFPGVTGFPGLGIALSRTIFHAAFTRHVPDGITPELALNDEERAQLEQIRLETLAAEAEEVRVAAEEAAARAYEAQLLTEQQQIHGLAAVVFDFAPCLLCGSIIKLSGPQDRNRCPAGGIGGPPFQGAPHVPSPDFVCAAVPGSGSLNVCRLCHCLHPRDRQGRCALRPGEPIGNFLVGSTHRAEFPTRGHRFFAATQIPADITEAADGVVSVQGCSKCACYCLTAGQQPKPCFDGGSHELTGVVHVAPMVRIP